MGSRIECFWMTPVTRGRESLRRYASSRAERTCPGPMWYHNAEVDLGEVEYPEDNYMGWGRDDVAHDDPRWPRSCECGYVFLEEDHWQHNMVRLFSGAPDGLLHGQRDMPPGAMWDAKWWEGQSTYDGITLCVMLPHGDLWMPDLPSKGGGAWQRSGAVPKVTCTPSILTPNYHGFLTDGFLVEC